MDERATFETRAVLPPKRARLGRLGLLVPAIALAATAWAGLSGGQAEPEAGGPEAAPTTEAAVDRPSPTAILPPAYPEAVIGLEVQPLDKVDPRGFGRDDVLALSGWYVATSITDCPPLAAIYREGSLPEFRPDFDEWAFCDRAGALYASRPELPDREPAMHFEDTWSERDGLPVVPVTLVIGILVPRELEIVGGSATPVVVVGRFVESGGCSGPYVCPRELVVDHVAWAPSS